jgi:DNA-binding transcriptional regulator GbsR (MarR family)
VLVPDARRDAVERIGGSLSEAGMPRLAARVFAALLVDDDGRMTSAELSEFLDVSAGGVSGAVKYLSHLGILRRERDRGSRRDVYVVDDDAWRGSMLQHERLYRPIRQALDRATELLADHDEAHRRLTLALEFLAFLETELDALDAKWQQYKVEHGLG